MVPNFTIVAFIELELLRKIGFLFFYEKDFDSKQNIFFFSETIESWGLKSSEVSLTICICMYCKGEANQNFLVPFFSFFGCFDMD